MSGSSRFAPHSFASVVYKGGRGKGVELRLRLYKRIEPGRTRLGTTIETRCGP